MISVAEARRIILDNATPLPSERCAISDAAGRTLRESIRATRAQPPFDASAMDGYAVRSADTPGVLKVVGQSIAGRAMTQPLQRNECARIFTGAPLPEGADAILIQEDAKRDGDAVTAPSVPPGRHVRPKGQDFAASAILLEPGRVLDAGAIGLAAAAGRAEIEVTRALRVGILSGGDEIVPPGAAPAPAQIFDSLSYSLAAQCAAWGAVTRTSTPLRDDSDVIARAIAAIDGDVLVVAGGASVGDHDHARAAARAIGAELLFAGVAVRPGKPTWFARRGVQLLLGLPGNPTSAMVCARLFLRPLIDALSGRDPRHSLAPRAMRLRAALDANGSRETYVRAISSADEQGQLWVEHFADQDSSLVTIFAAANALIIRPPHAGPASAGALADVLDL